MVGSKSEHGGIIKDGAKMVNAVSNSVVPKFTIITGNSFGAGNYAMCGKAYDPRLIAAWPWAELAVMGGAQAAKVLLQIQEATLKKQGKELSLKNIRNFWTKLLRIIINRLRLLTQLPDYGQMLLSIRLIPENGLAWELKLQTIPLLQKI
jgi:acetyl-CoA carboxylase carboxyltransferase component